MPFFIRYKNNLYKMSYQASFPALREFGFPLLPLSDLHSGNHAIHSAPPSFCASIGEIAPFFAYWRYHVSFLFFPTPLNIANFATHSSHRPYIAQGRDELELAAPAWFGSFSLLQGMYVPAQRCVCCIPFRPLPAFSDPCQPSVPALSKGP